MLVITRKVGESVVIGKFPIASMILHIDKIANDRVWLDMVGDASISAMPVTKNGMTRSGVPAKVQLELEHEFTVGKPRFVTVRSASIRGDRVRLAFSTDADVEVQRREFWEARKS